MSNPFQTGRVVAAGAAINISLGWIPDYVKVFNVTDGTVAFEWTSDMAAAYAIRSQNVVDNAATGNGSFNAITSNGISAFAGSGNAAPGFTIGSAIAVSGKTLAWVAARSLP